LGVAVVAGVALTGAVSWRAVAQTFDPADDPPITLLPPLSTTTPATSPPETTTPPTSSTDTATPSSASTPGTEGDVGGGDAGLLPGGGGPGQIVPDDAAAFLATLRRSAPSDNRALVAGEQTLLASGYDADQAARIAYGRFPIAAPARWVDDWLEPRFTATDFRYHLGLDIVAAYGAPLRSPADGTIDLYDDPAGGGLAVLVHDAEGTVYELAHMSELAPGIKRGVTVQTGDPLGRVGATGNATTPHCHFGVWMRGVLPTAPKPLVDQWVIDAAAGIDAILHPTAPSSTRPLLATALMRDAAEGAVATDRTAAPARAELLYAASASPTGGALRLAEVTVARLGAEVDWAAQRRHDAQARDAWRQASVRAWRVVAPLSPAPLRTVLGWSFSP
jgi:murein DD-endopeptidase MepM/ murein hydrolase activator NlpD